MRKFIVPSFLFLLILSFIVEASFVDGQTAEKDRLLFTAMSDASAGAWLGNGRIAVAGDEVNAIKIYDIAAQGAPTENLDLNDFLLSDPDHPESDMEDATRVGNRIYWITSHGRNKDGKERPGRYRFFATDIVDSGSLKPVGRPCMTLVPAMLKEPWAEGLGLKKATRLGEDLKKKERQKLAPKEEGLNIEALAAAPEGGAMYIGLRNPRPDGPDGKKNQALVLILGNGAEVVEKGAAPRFDGFMLWDLDNRGVRGMEYSASRKSFLIIAGSRDGKARFALYEWSGNREEQPRLLKDVDDNGGAFNPEALIVTPEREDALLISDDGTALVDVTDPSQCEEGELVDGNKCPNKFLIDTTKRSFHALWIAP